MLSCYQLKLSIPVMFFSNSQVILPHDISGFPALKHPYPSTGILISSNDAPKHPQFNSTGNYTLLRIENQTGKYGFFTTQQSCPSRQSCQKPPVCANHFPFLPNPAGIEPDVVQNLSVSCHRIARLIHSTPSGSGDVGVVLIPTGFAALTCGTNRTQPPSFSQPRTGLNHHIQFHHPLFSPDSMHAPVSLIYSRNYHDGSAANSFACSFLLSRTFSV